METDFFIKIGLGAFTLAGTIVVSVIGFFIRRLIDTLTDKIDLMGEKLENMDSNVQKIEKQLYEERLEFERENREVLSFVKRNQDKLQKLINDHES